MRSITMTRTSAAFTAKSAARPTVQASGDGRRRRARDTPKRAQKSEYTEIELIAKLTKQLYSFGNLLRNLPACSCFHTFAMIRACTCLFFIVVSQKTAQVHQSQFIN